MEQLLSRVTTMIEFIELMQKTELVPGFLNPMEGYVLFTLAADGNGAGAIVEIGSLFGKSTCWLAAGTKKTRREKVTAVDLFSVLPDQQYEDPAELAGKVLVLAGCEEDAVVHDPQHRGRSLHLFQNSLRSLGLLDYVEPVVASSKEAARDWNAPIRLLFIDGGHAYGDVKQDVELWSPFVVPGGYIMFHDVGEWPGVTRFHKEFTQARNGFTHLFQVASVGVSQRD